MKVGKPKSKRVSTRLRHKIEKASTAKQRKERKLAKKVCSFVYCIQGSYLVHDTDSISLIEPRMAIKSQEGSRYPQSVPVQSEDD